MADFGYDLSATDDLDANGREVEGEELVGQYVYRWLITPRGALVDDPDWGYGIHGRVHAALTDAELVQLGGELRAGLMALGYFDDVRAVVTRSAAEAFEARIELLTAAGPFELVFALTADNVRRILES